MFAVCHVYRNLLPVAEVRKERLSLRAGPSALAELREHGFSADRFSTMLGASGGPKWLVLSRIDRVLAETVIGNRSKPLDVIGSSIGTFRHLCFASGDHAAACDQFEQAYIAQSYEERPAATEVSTQSRDILRALLADGRAGRILSNPMVRSHVIASRLRAKLSDNGAAFRATVAAAALGNAFSRSSLALFFERVIFSSVPEYAPKFATVPTHNARLSSNNIEDAAQASGTIPFVMQPVRDPADAPKGLYLDGGIIDYHYDFRLRTEPGLILFPHFFERITPGWFDKALPWRHAAAEGLERTVMIAPSPAFVESLPGGRVPDRNDFVKLSTTERQKQWYDVIDRCGVLADTLHELIATDRFVEALRPF